MLLLPPSVLEAVFAAPDPEEETEEKADVDMSLAREKLHEYLDLLPPREADVVELVLLGKCEEDIGVVLGMRQPSVSARLTRARERLQWLAETEAYRCSLEELLDVLPEEVLAEALRRGKRQRRRSYKTAWLFRLVEAMVITTSVSDAARATGVDQPRVSVVWRALVLGLEAMSEEDPSLVRASRYLRAVHDHPRILRGYGGLLGK